MSEKETLFHIDTFGVRLRALREKNGLSRDEFYDRIEPDANYLSKDSKNRNVYNWESKNIRPSFEVIGQICKSFNCSADYLLGIQKERNHDIHFICEQTGLSERAIEALCTMQYRADIKERTYADIGNSYSSCIDTLDYLIKNYLDAPGLLEDLRKYLFTEIAPGQKLRFDNKGEIKNLIRVNDGDSFYSHIYDYIDSEIIDRAILQRVQEQLVELKKKIKDDKKKPPLIK